MPPPSRHLWRNWLARSAVNRKVAGSSPARCDCFSFFPAIRFHHIIFKHYNFITQFNNPGKFSFSGVAPSEAGVKQRMADIVSRRRMVELARAQATEIQVLRGELERLRMATFPALVQVD